jgi:hypothetical protein
MVCGFHGDLPSLFCLFQFRQNEISEARKASQSENKRNLLFDGQYHSRKASKGFPDRVDSKGVSAVLTVSCAWAPVAKSSGAGKGLPDMAAHNPDPARA